jgi:hypothetical protein
VHFCKIKAEDKKALTQGLEMKISSLEIFFFDQFCTIFLTMSVAEKSGSVRLDFRFFLGG